MDHSLRRAVAEARRHGDLYFAGLLSEDRINNAFGKARSLWQGWIYTPAVTMWVSVSMSEHGSVLPRCRGGVAGLATGPQVAAVFGRDGRLLHGAG